MIRHTGLEAGASEVAIQQEHFDPSYRPGCRYPVTRTWNYDYALSLNQALAQPPRHHPWHWIRQLLVRCSTSCIHAVDRHPGRYDELVYNLTK